VPATQLTAPVMTCGDAMYPVSSHTNMFDLAGAWATVIWSSSAGAHSLIAGVPVVCEAPHWICEIAAANRIEWIDQLPRMLFSGNTREAALQLLAWAIWSVEEIESGVAFKHLLHN